MKPQFLSPLALFASAALPLASALAAPSPTWIEPAEAGADFAIQGEYTGNNCAAQVIALGNGSFRIVGWAKGLPGTVEGAEKTLTVDAKTEGDRVTFDGSGWKGHIQNGVLSGTGENGKSLELKRIVRESPTLGAKPPEGAVVLFDGTSAEGWVGGKMDERKFLGMGTKSVRTFGDIHLHLEFRTPYMPEARGQARGNSGVYLQNRYECQILDSFGLEGADNEAGGLYRISRPKLNMCLPPLSWQTYDIDFESARYDAEGKKVKNAVITSRLNGVLIQDRVELPGTTAAAGQKEGPEPGPIYVQNHGNPVFFKNIWVVEKK